MIAGEKNVVLALVFIQEILMPPLHIKLGLIKQFVGALDEEYKAFKQLVIAFLRQT